MYHVIVNNGFSKSFFFSINNSADKQFIELCYHVGTSWKQEKKRPETGSHVNL